MQRAHARGWRYITRRAVAWSIGVWLGLTVIGIGMPTPGHAGTSTETTSHARLTWMHYLGRAVNFGGLVYILYYLIFKVARAPESLHAQREALIREIEEARDKKVQAEQKWAEIQTKLAHLDEELEQLRQRAEAEAQAESERILREARAEVERLKRLAEEEIRRATAFAIAEVQAYVATVATRLSEQLLRAHLTDADQVQIILRSLEKLKQSMR